MTLNRNQTKAALKEALKEWLDDKFAIFGRWTMGAVGATLITVLAYAMLELSGWHFGK